MYKFQNIIISKMIFYTFIKVIPLELQQKTVQYIKNNCFMIIISHSSCVHNLYITYMSFMAKHGWETLYQMTTTTLHVYGQKTTGHREWVLHNILLFLLCSFLLECDSYRTGVNFFMDNTQVSFISKYTCILEIQRKRI